MFLVPCLQDIEVCSDEKRINKTTKDHIFLEKDGQILKFKVSIPHLDITNAIETYLNNSKLDNCILKSEKYAKLYYPLNLIESVGKFKLEGNWRKTKNYFIPKPNALTEFLYDKYRIYNENVALYIEDLSKLSYFIDIYKEEDKDVELNIINTLKSKFIVELVEVYDLDLNQLEIYIENIEKMVGNVKSRTTLYKLRNILIFGEQSKVYINELGIENKFIKAIKKDKEKQKVK